MPAPTWCSTYELPDVIGIGAAGRVTPAVEGHPESEGLVADPDHHPHADSAKRPTVARALVMLLARTVTSTAR